MEDSNKINIIYIAGIGRSGSTLLERILGQVPGIMPLGETRFFWERGFLENNLCGCGKPFHECDFWTGVSKEVVGASPSGGLGQALERERALGLRKSVFPIKAVFEPAEFEKNLREHIDHLSKLYVAIARASGGNWLIDASKMPRYARILQRVPGLRLVAVHLVRDSRGYAYSTMRKRVRTEIAGATKYMPTSPWYRSAARWLYFNLASENLGIQGIPYMRVRYEDIIENPVQTVRQVLDFSGFGGGRDFEFIKGNTADLKLQHGLSGNPNRRQKGAISLRVDDEWKSGLDSEQFALVTMMTSPLLLRYGYPMRRKP